MARWQRVRHAAPWLIAGAAAMAWLTVRLQPSDEISVLLPTGDRVINEYFLVANAFRTLETLYIDVSVEPESETNLDALFATGDALYARLEASGFFRRIQYRIAPEEYGVLGDIVSESQASLLTADDLKAIEGRLTGEGIESALVDARRTLMGAAGIFSQQSIRRDPFNLTSVVASKFAGLGQRGSGAEIVDGAIVTADYRHLFMLAIPAFPPSDIARSRELVAFLERLQDESEHVRNTDITIRYAGGHFAYVDNSEVIRRDIRRTTIAVGIGIALLSLFAFRRLLAVVYVLAPATFGLVIGTAAYVFVNPRIAHVILGCASLLVGITVDYGIHVLYHQSSGHGNSSWRPLYVSITAAAATTIGGFTALLFSSVPGFRQLGFIGIVGILGSALFATVALPRLTEMARARRGMLPVAEWSERFRAWVRSHAGIAALGMACLVVMGAAGARHVRFDGDLRRLSYLSPAHQRDDTALRAVWEPFLASSVVVRGTDLDAALLENDRLSERLMDLRDEGIIDDFVSLTQILPAAKTQRVRWQQWAAFWSEGRVEALARETREASGTLGFSDRAFDEFFDRLSVQPRPLTLDLYDESGVVDLVNSRIALTEDGALVQSSFFTRDLDAFYRASRAIRETFPNAVIVNGQAFVKHTESLVSGEMLRLAGWAVLLVGVCLFVAFGAVEFVFAVLAPVVVSLVLTFGVLGYLDVPLNLISVVFVVFVVGAGDDYSIFLFGSALNAFRGLDVREEESGASIMLCAGTTILGFAALMLADHPALYTIGLTASVGILTCLVSCLVLSPLMAKLFLPAAGRFGIVTWAGAVRAGWTVFSLTTQTICYLIASRVSQVIRGKRDLAERGHVARSFIRNAFNWRIDHGLESVRGGVHRLGDIDSLTERPAIVVANHQSLFDIVLLASLPGDLVAVVKKWVLATPLMGRLLRDAEYIEMEPGDPIVTLERCAEALTRGRSVLFFPEGTRSASGRLQRFHVGAFELALRTGADIVPVLLTNTRSSIRRSGFAIGRYTCAVRVCPRVTRESFDYSQGPRALLKHVRSLLEARIEEDWALCQSNAWSLRRVMEPYRYMGLKCRMAVATSRRDPLLSALESLVPSGARVLDVGCGYGVRARLLGVKSLGRRVTGIDGDETAIRIARAAGRDEFNVSFAQTEDPLGVEGTFDTVLLLDCLNLGDEDADRMLSSSLAKLSPWGDVIVRERLSRGGRRRVARDAGACEGLFAGAGFRGVTARADLARRGEHVWVLRRERA